MPTMEENFNIFFVSPETEEEDGNRSSFLEAFELLKKEGRNFNPHWLSQEGCLSMEPATKHNEKIFIFNTFKGEGFEHIKNLGYRIYGPRCILSNLQNGQLLPKDKKRPIFNLAMKGVKICCTSIDKAWRENMMEMVCLMAGEMTRNLTEDVTHLIAGEVGSSKYMVALANNKIVMTKGWVMDVWQASQDKHIMAIDEVFKKHKCPCFLGLTVVVSGFGISERNQLRSFITKGGGTYSGELKMNECTHLIVKEAKGAKYEAARSWKIKIVGDKWLYDCMDKGRYLDTKPYEFCKTGKTAKTSTPERLSICGPNIMDVSNITCTSSDISMRLANESEMPMDQFSFAGKTIAESKLGVSGMDVDVTVQPADIFLDGCKIYLSGVQSSVLEKLKKIITAGGGFRAVELTEGVTHVVVDKRIATDLTAISKLVESPRLVSSNWLMDCFAQNAHVDESSYLRTDIDTKQQGKKKIWLPPKFQEDPGTTSEEKETPEPEANGESKKADSNEKLDDMDSDLMMANILSQYTMNENETVCEAKDPEVEISKVEKGNETESNSVEMTQDPNEWDEESTDDNGIFHRKTFMFFGIEGDLEDLLALEEGIKAQGGRIIYQGKKRQIADFGIVPISGFLVDTTVSEVLTVIWLKICLENGVLVPFDHWLARPMELPQGDVMEGFCICVSGYVGFERDTIMYLAQSLGALCQDDFARVRKASKHIEACTHLIVNAAGGSKYKAAKNWKIPAVGKEWLEACIKNGKVVREDDFHIDVLEAKQKEEQLNTTSSADGKESDTTLPPRSNRQTTRELNESNQDLRHEPDVDNKKMDVKETAESGLGEKANSECARYASEGQPKLSSDQTPSPTTKENVKAPTMTDDPNCSSDAINENGPRDVEGGKKAACHPNQSDNIKAAYSRLTTTTTTTPLDRRRKKLATQGAIESPSSTSTPVMKGGGETPGTFQHPDFRPKFNIAQFLDPDTPQTTRDLNTSTPLGEVFSRQIKKAVQNAADLLDDNATPASQTSQLLPPPLHGVVIAVARKLGLHHAMYNSLVVDLGGDYTWQYNDSVTHFVFQGRLNDTNKEFRKARNDGKIIVSPHWLSMCKEQGCRVDESIFPHHFNPLASGTAVCKETPSKGRATRNRGLQGDTPSRAVAGKTPSRKMPVLNIQEAVTRKPQSPATLTYNSGKESAETGSSEDNEKNSPDKSTSLSEGSSLKEAECPSRVPSVSSPATSDGKDQKATPGNDEDGTASGNKSSDSKSQEMRDALAKTLGTVLEESSRSKKTKKKIGRIAKLSGGQLGTSGVKTPENTSRTGTPSTWSAKEPEKDNHQFPEPSQSLQVTWDDPTERLEKEKLAHRLERVCDPSQNTDDFMAGLELPSTVEQPPAHNVERSPTPEAPSIAFPVPQPPASVSAPQPVVLLSDESCDGHIAANVVKETPIFLFSGMKDGERVEYGALVEELGGKVLDKQHFDPACTHLVVAHPVRNEKYLSSIAAGKWVLHKSYLEACRRENKLVTEEPHEWGSQFTMSIMQNMTSQSFKLGSAAHKWRQKVSAMRKATPACCGAFDGWKVMLCLGGLKEDNFKRMLHAGGADVILMRPPFSESLNVTHAFLDLAKVKIPEADLTLLISLGMHCLKAEYIAAYLMEDPLPDPCDFYHTEVVALKASMPDQSVSRKRRASNSEDKGVRKMSRI